MLEEEYRLIVDEELAPGPTRPALIWAEGIARPIATAEPSSHLADVISAVRVAGEEAIPAAVRARVRDMLRHGRYKPTGRGKPASEFLLRAALDGTFPLVNPPVDVNNAISLSSGFPASIFDGAKAGHEILMRRGRAGESYVFNPSGQTIDLEDLLLVCRRVDGHWDPIGNPVKDAMTTKIGPETHSVVAVLYAPSAEPAVSAERWAARYAEFLRTECAARTAGHRIADV